MHQQVNLVNWAACWTDAVADLLRNWFSKQTELPWGGVGGQAYVKVGPSSILLMSNLVI